MGHLVRQFDTVQNTSCGSALCTKMSEITSGHMAPHWRSVQGLQQTVLFMNTICFCLRPKPGNAEEEEDEEEEAEYCPFVGSLLTSPQ
jgi:hypothetical protein